jgi:Ca2+-binding RTX toxin-like protein
MAVINVGNQSSGYQASGMNQVYVVGVTDLVSGPSTAFDFGTTQLNSLLVRGSVISSSNSNDIAAISGTVGSTFDSVTIVEGGFVEGFTLGITLAGSNHTVTNDGEIRSLVGVGLLIDAASTSVHNGGRIAGGMTGVVFSSGASNVTLVNAGNINGAHVDTDSQEGSFGVFLDKADGWSILNSGTIAARVGVAVVDSAQASPNFITNTGTISGALGHEAIIGGDAKETITNTGLIIGNVVLKNGDDVITNSGTIVGQVVLGDGEDTYVAKDGGTSGEVFGGKGADLLSGGDGDDILSGGQGKDRLFGQAGGDTFLFDTKPNKTANIDHIADMVHLTDFIALDHTIFKAIKVGSGHLKGGAFFSEAGAHNAHDSNDRVVYDTTSGKLYYDRDGAGGDNAKLFAVLDGSPNDVSAADFLIVA